MFSIRTTVTIDRTSAYRHRRLVASALTVVVATAFLAVSSGCSLTKKLGLKFGKEEKQVQATPKPKPTPPGPPQIDYAKVRPNELGRIPIMMYHEVGGKMPKHDYGLVRTVEGFKKDLELMYDAGFRPVNMADIMSGKIDVPAGFSPVVLTFDDARESQFRLIETDKSLKIDPDCAVGILTEFHKKHPDWALKGTFFALPKSRTTIDSFGQAGLGADKLQYLIKNGFEIGNHTTLHKNMAHMPPEQIQQEIGNANNVLMEAAPDAKISVVALPMGVYPRKKENWKYLVSGSYGGKSYNYAGAMLAAYRPIPSPASKDFNPLRMERISPMDNDPNGLRNWLIKLTAVSGNRYISDGDPNTVSYPKSEASEANLALIKSQGLLANAYAPFGGEGGSKPIVASGDDSSPSPSTDSGDKTEKFEVVAPASKPIAP